MNHFKSLEDQGGIAYDTVMFAPRVVLDTNVLVAALRSRRDRAFHLLSLVGSDRFETAVSVPLVFEYEDVLSREGIGVPASVAVDVID